MVAQRQINHFQIEASAESDDDSWDLENRRETIDRLRAQGRRPGTTDSENREYGWNSGRMWLQTSANLAQIRRLLEFAGHDPSTRIRAIQNDDNSSLGRRLFSALSGRDCNTISECEAEKHWGLVLRDNGAIENPAFATGFLEGVVEAWSAFKDEILAEGSSAPFVYGTVPSGEDESDGLLDAIRYGILIRPDSDGSRVAFGKRLDELGEHEAAEKVLRQVDDPSLSESVSGERAGIPLAVTAEFHRGFVASIVLPRAHLRRLGKILDNHPITSVRILESDDLILIHHNVRPDPSATKRKRKIRKKGQDSELPLMWAVEFRRRASPIQIRYWSRREMMEASVGVWLDRLVPPCRSEPDENAGHAVASSAHL